MPHVSDEERRSADRSYRRSLGRYSRQSEHVERASGIRSMIASGRLDSILLVPTKGLENTVFNTYFDEKDFGRLKKVVKGYSGTSRDYWNVLVAIAEGNVTVGSLRRTFGDQRAISSLTQALDNNLVELDKGEVQASFGLSDEEVELRESPRHLPYRGA